MDNIEYLVELAAQGDASAFEALYQQTCKSVYFTALSFLKNEQDAADATQEVYLTVLNKLSALNDKSKFIPWLNRITVNKCKDMLIKKKPVLVDYDEMEYLNTEENENFLPEEYITNQAKRKIVMDIMRNSLSDVLYQTVIMYYFNGLSVTEIAEIMGCQVGTVTYRLSAARAKIKEGVLNYENINNDKLYSFAAVPFLTSLLVAEMQCTRIPDIYPGFISAASNHAVAVKAAKKGVKTMFKTLKAKVIAGAVAAVIVVGGIAAAVVVSNKEDEKGDTNGGTGIAADDSRHEDTEATSRDVSDQDDREAVQETPEEDIHSDKRFLLQQDFSTGQLEGIPEGFTLCKSQISASVTIESIKQTFDAEAHVLPYGGSNGTEHIMGSAEEVLSLEDYYFYDYTNNQANVYLNTKGTEDTEIYMLLYNLSNQEDISVAECVNNDWWSLYTEISVSKNLLGIDVEDDKETLEYLIAQLGSPNYLYVNGKTPEEFIAGAAGDEEVVLDYYDLAWIFDDYVLYIYCMDGWVYDHNEFEMKYAYYMPRDVWEEKGFEAENHIEQLFH